MRVCKIFTAGQQLVPAAAAETQLLEARSQDHARHRNVCSCSQILPFSMVQTGDYGIVLGYSTVLFIRNPRFAKVHKAVD
jgi:hypothetical protein